MSSARCQQCDAAIPPESPFGQCPACLLESAGLSQPGTAKLEPFSFQPRERRVGDYILGTQLAAGGMGVVYRAHQVSLNREVAVKFIRDSQMASPVVRARFMIEAEAAARLHHPNIVRIHEIGEFGYQPYFSMDLIEGESLGTKIAKEEFVIPNEGSSRDVQIQIVQLIAKVAHAIHHAHQRGVLHRDLKPANIVIDQQGEPHVTDFGLAKILSPSSDSSTMAKSGLTAPGDFAGTPSYMAPEQASGASATPSSDVYGIGAILYELLTGKPPFQGPTPLETLRRTKEEEPLNPRTANPAIHRDLATICLKCLEKSPLRRYGTAAEFAADLERWLRCEPVMARPASIAIRTQRWMERNRAGTAVIACLLAGLLLSLFLLKRTRDEETAKQGALVALKRVITSQIGNLNKPPPSAVIISSEQLAVLHGREPKDWKQAATRYKVATFIWSNPLETILGYQRLFEALEGSLSRQCKRRVALDCYLYLDYQQAADDLLQGKVDLLHADPRLTASLSKKARVPVLAKEKAGTVSCSIFTRWDSGITNLAALRGRSILFWDRHSSFTLLAKAMLADNGLCATNVRCIHLYELPGASAARETYLESPEQGYFDRQGETVRQVLDLNAYAAGVARTRQFRLKKDGEWRVLAEFGLLRNFWIGTPKMTPEVAHAFQQSFLRWAPAMVGQFSNTEQDNDNYGAGYEVYYHEASPEAIKEIEQALAREAKFENCSPALATSGLQSSFEVGDHH